MPVREVVKPDRLRPGDTISILSPASPSLTPAHQEQGKATLEGLGYRVVTGRHANDRHLLFAGTERSRGDDINEAFGNPSVKAIICARGGCGTAQILPCIDFTVVRNNPKILVGYSDITALQVALFNATGLITFYGPMAASDFGRESPRFTSHNLLKALTQTQGPLELRNPPRKEMLTICPGTAEGRLAGGCLSVLIASLATPYEIDTKDRILFFEDIDEQPHRIDRYLTQLIQAGKLQEARGIVFGAFTQCEYRRRDDYYRYDVSLWDIIQERIAPLSVPAVYGLQFGHVRSKLTIPFGGHASLDATNCRLVVEPCVV